MWRDVFFLYDNLNTKKCHNKERITRLTGNKGDRQGGMNNSDLRGPIHSIPSINIGDLLLVRCD